MMNPYLFSALDNTPYLVDGVFSRLDLKLWDVPTHPDRFTPREVIAHLMDWEPILLDRIRTGVETPGSLIAAYDEGEMAIENNYSAVDPAKAMAQFKVDRAGTIAFLSNIEPSDWSKTVRHPERGELTVYDIAHMIVCHDIYHITQLEEAI